MRYSVFRSPAADLELRLAGASATDAAGQPREAVVLQHQTRHRVLELRELHLKLAVAALGALGEDVQNQLCAVDDLEVGVLGDGARLCGRELPIEHQDAGVELDRTHD